MLTLGYDELLRYTQEERDRWRRFFTTNPQALESAVHPGGRFSTVGKLIDHVFLVERRHVQRLRGEPLAVQTGLTGNNAPPLFDYGASVRRELEGLVEGLDEDEANEVRMTVSGGVASFPSAGVDHPDLLIKRADEALYAAKQGGRNQIVRASELDAST